MEKGKWIKARKSGGAGNCVEVMQLNDGGMAVRNSRRLGQEPLVFTAAEWDAFLDGAKKGEFDK